MISRNNKWQPAARETVFLSQEFWLKPAEALKIAELAHALLEDNLHSRIFSLGQSPAWLVRSVEKEVGLRGLTVETGYIPFSGAFLSMVGAEDSAYLYMKNAALCPPHEATIEAYRVTLKSLGLDPKTIVQNFKSKNQTTTIVEFVCTGRSIASFLYILGSWAKKEGVEKALHEALNVRLYWEGKGYTGAIKAEDCDPFPCAYSTLDFSLKDRLWNCSSDVRIVPTYNSHQWHRPAGSAEGLPSIVEITERQLGEALRVLQQDLPAMRPAMFEIPKQGLRDARP